METVKTNTQFGLPTKNATSLDVQQQYDDTCAIKSQELILNAAGANVTEDQLVTEAYQNGWYTPGQGTSMEDVGKLLESHGMNVEQVEHGSMFNLVSELSQNHPVIVGVDSGELWNAGVYERFEDVVIGPRADHALIVSGVEFNDDFTDGMVNVIDPGSGDFCKEYSCDQFEDAWADSGNFMVSIN